MTTRTHLFTLDVGPRPGESFAPDLTALTFPLLRHYARKIHADFHVITERKFPDWPVACEKFQLFSKIADLDAEWAMFLDADALVHPQTPDWTAFLNKDTVAHNGHDHAAIRWSPHAYFLRDGRHIGSCNWCSIASAWCRDFWHPPDDLDPVAVLDEIHPVMDELATGFIDKAHLADDYLMSLNIARYGLKFETLTSVEKRVGLEGGGFLWHVYMVDRAEKLRQMHEVLWGKHGRTYVDPHTRQTRIDQGWNPPASLLPTPKRNPTCECRHCQGQRPS
jgi:hypothetical protein